MSQLQEKNVTEVFNTCRDHNDNQYSTYLQDPFHRDFLAPSTPNSGKFPGRNNDSSNKSSPERYDTLRDELGNKCGPGSQTGSDPLNLSFQSVIFEDRIEVEDLELIHPSPFQQVAVDISSNGEAALAENTQSSLPLPEEIFPPLRTGREGQHSASTLTDVTPPFQTAHCSLPLPEEILPATCGSKQPAAINRRSSLTKLRYRRMWMVLIFAGTVVLIVSLIFFVQKRHIQSNDSSVSSMQQDGSIAIDSGAPIATGQVGRASETGNWAEKDIKRSQEQQEDPFGKVTEPLTDSVSIPSSMEEGPAPKMFSDRSSDSSVESLERKPQPTQIDKSNATKSLLSLVNDTMRGAVSPDADEGPLPWEIVFSDDTDEFTWDVSAASEARRERKPKTTPRKQPSELHSLHPVFSDDGEKSNLFLDVVGVNREERSKKTKSISTQTATSNSSFSPTVNYKANTAKKTDVINTGISFEESKIQSTLLPALNINNTVLQSMATRTPKVSSNAVSNASSLISAESTLTHTTLHLASSPVSSVTITAMRKEPSSRKSSPVKNSTKL